MIFTDKYGIEHAEEDWDNVCENIWELIANKDKQ